MSTHQRFNNKINTYQNYDCSWTAAFDDYDGAPLDYNTPSDDPMGHGWTEQEAIDDLLEIAL